METAQKKTTEAQKRATKKYANSKWRPNVYIEPTMRETIEKHFTSKGYNSFNEYIIALISKDIETDM